MTQIFDGKALADKILLELKRKIVRQKRRPGLATILIGNNPASKLYIRNKEKACHKIGMNFHKYLCNKDCFPEITEIEISKMIGFLNKDREVDGIIVQLPIPKKFSTKKIISAINPKKDVDGFHPQNLKKFFAGNPYIISPLIQAVLAILKETKKRLANKNIVILSHSKIFSHPLEKILKDKKAKTKIVSTKKRNLGQITKKADILISVIGKPQFIKKNMVKIGAIVIDAGITLTKGGWKGDIDFEKVKKVVSFITPVPGGVGPVTVAMLLKNTYELACHKN